jgi:hypothetical protein
MKLLTRLAFAACLCGATSCELTDDGSDNGTGPGGGGPDVTVDLPSTASLDGWVRSDGNLAATGNPITGDIDAAAPGLGYRQFYSFDLSGLPSGATIVGATLSLYQAGSTGAPYAELGNVVVEHVDYGDMLDPTDYATTPLGGTAATLSTNATVGYKTVDVTARVAADVAAARSRSQFRLRFSTLDSNNDGGSDFAQFNDAEAAANRPVLSVTYR